LLAIGPPTNIVLLFAIDPEIPSLHKGLVMMPGRFASNGASANRCSIGLDVTEQITAKFYSHQANLNAQALASAWPALAR
jgi:hypothetical protein